MNSPPPPAWDDRLTSHAHAAAGRPDEALADDAVATHVSRLVPLPDEDAWTLWGESARALQGMREFYADEAALRARAEGELARHQRLLQGLAYIQADALLADDPAVPLRWFLTELLELTDSAAAWLGEAVHDGDGWILRTLASAPAPEIAASSPGGEIVCAHAHPAGRVVLTHGPVVLHEPGGGAELGLSELRNFAGLPLRIGSDVVGVLWLANRPAGFDAATLHFLEPVAATCAHLVIGLRGRRASRQADIDLASFARDLELAHEFEQRNAARMETLVSELDAQRRRAEAATQAKSEFLSNMSHEIRTPMTAILGFADTLLDASLPESERLQAVQTIRRNGDHLLTIINDILDLSKLEAGQFTVEAVECSPHEIVTDVYELLRARADERGLSFEAEFPEPTPARILTDPTRLRQILLNLAGNALKFTAKGSVRIVVRNALPAADGRRRLTFDVVDTGIGIDPEQQPHLFQPFSQGDSTVCRRFGGTGLGLAISRRLARLLGGDVTLVSLPGQGSRFCATIDAGPPGSEPLPPTRLGPERRKAVRPATAATAETLLQGRILLVEDSPDNQRLISFYLQKSGLQVELAGNGQEALDRIAAAAAPFDIVLMDLQMPVMDGETATQRLRAKGYSGLIVALTANAMSDVEERCRRAGCNDYLSKPIDRPRLAQLLRTHLPPRG